MKKNLVVSEEKVLNKDSALNTVLLSLLTMVLGIFLIVSTNKVLEASNYVLVCIFAFIGVIQLINFLVSRKDLVGSREKLNTAVVFIWLALVLFQYYYNMIILLPILFSLYLLVTGSSLIIKYVNLKNVFNIKSIIHLVMGIITILVCILLIF